ncbi:MAG: sulfotransferase domain-containing protein [Planctomycetota bacterium]
MPRTNRLPHFLVIGGMKCGSTTLYDDLSAQPGVTLAEKECNVLSRPGDTAEQTIDAYAREFGHGASSDLRGDVSTTYTMLPVIDGVAERAARVLPPSTKIVYIVREPVSRAISHHHHMHSHAGPERMAPDINDCVGTRPELIDFGRYAMQLEPWARAFSERSIHVIRFEDYIAAREETLAELLRFLGASNPKVAPLSSLGSNRSASKPLIGRRWLALSASPLYRNTLRRVTPRWVRAAAQRALFPGAPATYGKLSESNAERIRRATAADCERLRELSGRAQPLWPTNTPNARAA